MSVDEEHPVESSPPDPAAPAPAASVRVLLGGPVTRIVLTGDIDVSASRRFTDAVSQAEHAARPVLVDARDVTFMDSTGIALLARLATRVPGTVRIVEPPDVVRFLLDATRVGDMVEVFERADAPARPTPLG